MPPLDKVSQLMTTSTMSTILIPRPYQEDGIRWLIDKQRGLLGDAPGLGKTLQAAEAAIRSGNMPALIIAPAHLVKQWALFLKRQYPGTKVSYSEKNHYLEREHHLKQKADWYVASLSMLQKASHFPWPEAKTIIFDESHHLKSRKTHQARGAEFLSIHRPYKAKNIILLSATPVRREFDDMYQQLRLIDPGMFKSYNTFVHTFCSTEESKFGEVVTGIKASVLADLRKLLDMYMLRRTYPEVGMYLPELIEQEIPVDFDDATQKTYNRVRDNYLLQFEAWEASGEGVPLFWAMEVLQTLRQLTCSREKLYATTEIARDLPRPVIFTWYQHSAEILAGMLGTKAITGETKASERSRIAQEQDIAVVSLGSMSEGVDLSDFRSVIFFEEDYSPGRNFQALSRVARFGFEEGQPLLVYYVQVTNSVDERIHRIAAQRASSIKDIMKEVLV